jgi:hypothetical protein
MHVILATQEAEIRRVAVPSHPGQIVQETLSRKYAMQKTVGAIKSPKKQRAGGVTQV